MAYPFPAHDASRRMFGITGRFGVLYLYVRAPDVGVPAAVGGDRVERLFSALPPASSPGYRDVGSAVAVSG